MKMKTRWTIHFLIIMIPFSIPLAAGFYWLWLHQLLILWLSAAAVLGGIWWLINQRLSRQDLELELLDISPSVEKTAQSKRAYEKIEQISAVHRNSNPDLASSEFYMQTLLEVMRAVAEQYYPKRKDALLEIKLPYLLKVIEMLAQELRVSLSENVPGSHIFSVNDIVRSQRLANRGRELYRLFRIVSAGLDPISAMVRELRILATDSLLTHSTEDIKRWLIDAYIKKIGYYAIELYSGNLILDNSLFAHATRSSQQELDKIKHREAAASAEPFRILVLGQTNAGKSSLINVLFGVKKAETDVVPTTEGITSYLLERPGLETAIISDCEGYGSDGYQGALSTRVSEEIVRSDIIILVISAINVARAPDKKMLQTIRDCFEAKNRNSLPPIAVALTHVDQLRPLREWSPPYDVIKPGSPKAQAIRLMMETVTTELGLKIEQIAPVNLKPGFEYNVEEGLIPAVFQQLEQAKQVRYLRCLKEYRKEDYWRRLWNQSKRAGQYFAKKGFSSLEKSSAALPEKAERGGESR
ncbi:MAG: GTPase [Methylobacter sp.]|uniref:GTPase family protein n=1 Tax=Methylobacter sp. TaxID=2051955 RepID=UPI002731D2EF|nr:GTPase [Methylobacter sp.]MDP1665579.1 GTPase [Methylobacter sp.]